MRSQDHTATELTAWLATAPAWRGSLRVTVVVPDDTRPLQPKRVLPPVLAAIAEASRRRGALIQTTILVASGLHAPPKKAFCEEIERCLHPFRSDPRMSIRWDTHNARDVERLGHALNPLVCPRGHTTFGQADRVVTISAVEPHQYAGFSGGSKSLSIGCASTSTIASMHSVRLLRDPNVAIASVDHNPFRHALDALAVQHAAPTFSIHLVPSPREHDRCIGLFSGTSEEAWKRAAKLALEHNLIPTPNLFDFAILSVPSPKAANFYQASRALTYVALHPSPCVRKGGTIVLLAACPDGFGKSAAEDVFRTMLGRGVEDLLVDLNAPLHSVEDLPGGAQRAYMCAQALRDYTCVVVGAPTLPEAQTAGLLQHDSLDALSLEGAGLWVDDPFATTPYYRK